MSPHFQPLRLGLWLCFWSLTGVAVFFVDRIEVCSFALSTSPLIRNRAFRCFTDVAVVWVQRCKVLILAFQTSPFTWIRFYDLFNWFNIGYRLKTLIASSSVEIRMLTILALPVISNRLNRNSLWVNFDVFLLNRLLSLEFFYCVVLQIILNPSFTVSAKFVWLLLRIVFRALPPKLVF